MIKKILQAAVNLNLCITVGIEGEVDYEGFDVDEAMEAVEACDEIEVELTDDDGGQVGWMFIVNDLDEEEKIVDCNFWVDNLSKQLL